MDLLRENGKLTMAQKRRLLRERNTHVQAAIEAERKLGIRRTGRVSAFTRPVKFHEVQAGGTASSRSLKARRQVSR